MNEAQATEIFENFGLSIENRIKEELGGKLTDEFPEVEDIKNLAGESMGYMRVYKADKLVKACCMSITVMPGARYFNIHIHPEAKYRVPRFGFEGMITLNHPGQVSMDIYPDTDLVMNIREFKEQTAAFTPIYDAAKQTELNVQPSRLMHMRALCSPFFMNCVGTTVDQLPQIESFANQYFDEWLKLFQTAEEVSPEEADDRWRRREHFANMVMELDPDRQMIVQVFGEETTVAIERALMI